MPIYIKDLSLFRSEIFGCETKFVCCYRDLNHAKQKQALSAKFKRLYENQTVMAYVESVTVENV